LTVAGTADFRVRCPRRKRRLPERKLGIFPLGSPRERVRFRRGNDESPRTPLVSPPVPRRPALFPKIFRSLVHGIAYMLSRCLVRRRGTMRCVHRSRCTRKPCRANGNKKLADLYDGLAGQQRRRHLGRVARIRPLGALNQLQHRVLWDGTGQSIFGQSRQLRRLQ